MRHLSQLRSGQRPAVGLLHFTGAKTAAKSDGDFLDFSEGEEKGAFPGVGTLWDGRVPVEVGDMQEDRAAAASPPVGWFRRF